MAADCSVTIIAEVTGLGIYTTLAEKFSVTTVPTKSATNRQVQTTTDVAELLNLCGIASPTLIIIKATTKGLSVDTKYVSSFVEKEYIPEGEVRILRGSSPIYLKNKISTEVFTCDYLIVG